MLFRRHWVFSWVMLSGVAWATLHKVFACTMLSQEYYDIIEQDVFMWNVFWRLLDNVAQGFCLCNGVPKVLRQHWTIFISVQCCLEPIGQNCTRLLPMQCCPKSIKTTWNSIFSCEMLSRASWTTLHKVFTCAMLSQEYYDIIEQDFFMWNVFWRLLNNAAQGFCLCNVVPKVLRQHWTVFFPVQCCLEPIGQSCTRFLPVQ